MKLTVKQKGKSTEPTVEFSLGQEKGETDVDIYANGQLIAFFNITEDGIVLKLIEGIERYESVKDLFIFTKSSGSIKVV